MPPSDSHRLNLNILLHRFDHIFDRHPSLSGYKPKEWIILVSTRAAQTVGATDRQRSLICWLIAACTKFCGTRCGTTHHRL